MIPDVWEPHKRDTRVGFLAGTYRIHTWRTHGCVRPFSCPRWVSVRYMSKPGGGTKASEPAAELAPLQAGSGPSGGGPQVLADPRTPLTYPGHGGDGKKTTGLGGRSRTKHVNRHREHGRATRGTDAGAVYGSVDRINRVGPHRELRKLNRAGVERINY
ncbi:hypothetical protein BHE74_00029927 [Ensete ventricosum]|nr:hypothetical protein GW17_00046019 [Ensete ventricosum]RWW62923.1 hypothetical protein BHE74_00029927 [Ensete ventricosum]